MVITFSWYFMDSIVSARDSSIIIDSCFRPLPTYWNPEQIFLIHLFLKPRYSIYFTGSSILMNRKLEKLHENLWKSLQYSTVLYWIYLRSLKVFSVKIRDDWFCILWVFFVVLMLSLFHNFFTPLRLKNLPCWHRKCWTWVQISLLMVIMQLIKFKNDYLTLLPSHFLGRKSC